jgi:hypothetical protein
MVRIEVSIKARKMAILLQRWINKMHELHYLFESLT